MFVEGTYPYVTGGVSTWLQTLMENLPEHEFEIYHLSPDSKEKEVKYAIPPNVISIHEINIFSEVQWKKLKKPDERILDRIFDAIVFNQEIPKMAEDMLEALHELAGKGAHFLFDTKKFWDILIEIYERFFEKEGFSNYYWTIKNMLLPIVNSFQFIPKGFDVLHTITTGYASLSALSGKILYKTPMIITEHGIYHREREKEILASKVIPEIYKKMWIGLFKLISAIGYASADYITTLFKKNQLFQLELNADKEKMLVIPNGINVEEFSLPREKHENFNIGFVGRVSKIKDVKTAIKAMRVVKERIKEAKFLIIGPYEEERDYYEECVELVEILNLKDSVEFLGLKNVKEFYPILDVLLLSSVSEGQPLVILEAMAAGVPIVTTDVGACSEMVKDGDLQSGFVVKPKDYISMAKAIIKLYEDTELREKFSKDGREIVRKKYRLDMMINGYKKLYEKAVKMKEVPSLS